MKSRQQVQPRLTAAGTIWLAVFSSVWATLIMVAPLAVAPLALMAYALGGVVCHQIPSRSFHIGDAQFAVCARCTGIYVGAAVGLWWCAFRLGRENSPAPARIERFESTRAARFWLLVGVVPTAITVGLEQIGTWQTSNAIRAVAGLPLGVAVAVVVGRAATLHYSQWRQRRPV